MVLSPPGGAAGAGGGAVVLGALTFSERSLLTAFSYSNMQMGRTDFLEPSIMWLGSGIIPLRCRSALLASLVAPHSAPSVHWPGTLSCHLGGAAGRRGRPLRHSGSTGGSRLWRRGTGLLCWGLGCGASTRVRLGQGARLRGLLTKGMLCCMLGILGKSEDEEHGEDGEACSRDSMAEAGLMHHGRALWQSIMAEHYGRALRQSTTAEHDGRLTPKTHSQTIPSQVTGCRTQGAGHRAQVRGEVRG